MSAVATAATGYEPRFPNAHALLMEVYKQAITVRGEDSDVWCERVKAITKAWEALKDDGILPAIFLQGFYLDVRNVMLVAHENLNPSELTEKQKLLTFAMAHLQNEFGAPSKLGV